MNRRTFLLPTFFLVSFLSIGCQPVSLSAGKENASSSNVVAGERRRQQTTLMNSSEVTISGKANEVNLANATPSPTPKPKPANAVCPDPKKPCKTKDKEFAEWELSFRLPAKIKPNTNYKSASFYAIILKKYEQGCDELDVNPKVEPERLRIQKQYPTRKVFASYDCANMDATGYDFAEVKNKNGDSNSDYMNYIAIYAGDTPEEANQLFNEVKAKFPKAEIKKMTANWSLIDQ